MSLNFEYLGICVVASHTTRPLFNLKMECELR